ncbi:MAG: DedA family protein [Planctomycetaceae bacterium]|jgi:membrane protein YqaA with SNARE-associated domain|nr:DedA family protein [Planctomycetaceae bacterium]
MTKNTTNIRTDIKTDNQTDNQSVDNQTENAEAKLSAAALVLGRRNIVRRLYDWVLSWAGTPYGSPALFILSFMESSFFPVPPDVLQIALSAGRPSRSFWYATVSLVGSVLGALLGYYIGYVLWVNVQSFFFTYIFNESLFNIVKEKYSDAAFWSIFTAAFTPIPYKIFTIAAGVCQLSITTLVIASVLGRGLRFYLVASLMFIFGASVRNWIDAHFNKLTIIFTILLIGGFVAIKYIMK